MASPNSTRNPPYRIETERLVLRCWAPSDAVAMRASLDASADHLRPFIPFMRAEPRTLSETAGWLRTIRAAFDSDTHYRFAMLHATSGELVGEAMLLNRTGDGPLEVGYWQDIAHCGQGYATEAARAMVWLGLEVLGAPWLELVCTPKNHASIKVARKLGFVHDATLRRRLTDCPGPPRDAMVWTMFPDDRPDWVHDGAVVRAVDCLGQPLRPPGVGA